jgi:hypothetical protein
MRGQERVKAAIEFAFAAWTQIPAFLKPISNETSVVLVSHFSVSDLWVTIGLVPLRIIYQKTM